MIKIDASVNKTITVTDTEFGSIFVALGNDCELIVFFDSNMYYPETIKKRSISIYNKYNRHIIASFNGSTLDPSSIGYTQNMDDYAIYLITNVLYI